MRYMILAWLIVFGCLSSAAPASAHEVRPAYLRIQAVGTASADTPAERFMNCGSTKRPAVGRALRTLATDSLSTHRLPGYSAN